MPTAAESAVIRAQIEVAKERVPVLMPQVAAILHPTAQMWGALEEELEPTFVAFCPHSTWGWTAKVLTGGMVQESQNSDHPERLAFFLGLVGIKTLEGVDFFPQ